MAPTDRWASRDVIGEDKRQREYPEVEATPGLRLIHRPSRITGVVTVFTAGQRVVLQDEDGNLHSFKPHPRVLLLNGKPVELIAPAASSAATVELTASGSVKAAPVRARQAQSSRIWVEGIHDAELIETIWGDDLRVEGIVVEPMHGIDTLPERISDFRPGPQRRLGVLLDHLVSESKESRIAAVVADANVLIRGHPYVDIWQAIKPQAIGIATWPRVPRRMDWKEGVVAALGRQDDPGVFWRQILDRVSSYRDVETPLVNAMEQLIDFVTVG